MLHQGEKVVVTQAELCFCVTTHTHTKKKPINLLPLSDLFLPHTIKPHWNEKEKDVLTTWRISQTVQQVTCPGERQGSKKNMESLRAGFVGRVGLEFQHR